MTAEYGYKQTEVGIIPEEWAVKILRSVLTTARLGGNYANQNSESAYPLMKMGNIGRGAFDLSKVEYIEPNITPEDTHRLAWGDVLFNTRNTLELVGKVAIWRDALPLAYYNSNLMRLEFDANEICSAEYANYAFNTRDAIARLRALATGTTSVAAIYTRDLLNFSFVVPTQHEQEAIAEALSDADALIESLKRLIAKKRQIKQGAMRQLLTGRKRLPGFSGKWTPLQLGSHVMFLKTGTNSRADLSAEGAVAYLHYGDIHTCKNARLNPGSIAMPHIEEQKVRRLDRLKTGDLVFVDASEDLEGVGKSVEVGNVPSGGLVAGLHTIAARFDKAELADGFKAYLQFCPQFTRTLRRFAAGTKVFATNRRHIKEAEVLLPTVSEQKAIASVLSDMDAEIIDLETRLAKARQVKQGMMQQLLTGRIRLVKPQAQPIGQPDAAAI